MAVCAVLGRDDATVKDAMDRLRGRRRACRAAPGGGLLSALYAEVAEKAPHSSSRQGIPVRLSEEELAAVL
jgi:hypothetical protein